MHYGFGSARRAAAAVVTVLLAALVAVATSSAGAQSRKTQAKRGTCAPLDLAFVVDTTGSMGPAIENVKDGLRKIVREARTVAADNLRLSLVTFKDSIFVEEPFAQNNEDRVARKIRALSAAGGNFEPEASDVALETAVRGLRQSDRSPGQQTGDFRPPFRRRAEKIAVIITDARPGGFDDRYSAEDKEHAASVARAARNRGIRISSVYVPTRRPESEEREVMRTYARISRGQFRQTDSDGSGTATAINATIATCAGKPIRPLRVRVRPRSWREDRRKCFRFKVTSRGKAVRRATVRFAGRRARTNRRGRARICVTIGRPGIARVRARKRGFVPGSTVVFITRAPRFTG